jgi:hypothetical protein
MSGLAVTRVTTTTRLSKNLCKCIFFLLDRCSRARSFHHPLALHYAGVRGCVPRTWFGGEGELSLPVLLDFVLVVLVLRLLAVVSSGALSLSPIIPMMSDVPT